MYDHAYNIQYTHNNTLTFAQMLSCTHVICTVTETD